MKLLVAKILSMVGVFFLMLLGALLPVKVIETDLEKAHRSRKVLSLCNTLGGGVFLATCFNALLPSVREKVSCPTPSAKRNGVPISHPPSRSSSPPQTVALYLWLWN